MRNVFSIPTQKCITQNTYMDMNYEYIYFVKKGCREVKYLHEKYNVVMIIKYNY